MKPDKLPVALASTSPYRRELLARLLTEFSCAAPGTDESALPGEPPRALAARLARHKAEAAARTGTLVIGSDQVAALDNEVLTKPGALGQARQQLQACSGRRVVF